MNPPRTRRAVAPKPRQLHQPVKRCDKVRNAEALEISDVKAPNEVERHSNTLQVHDS